MKNQHEATKGQTDWNRVRAMTEKEIIAAAKSDPDAQPLTKAQLKGFVRVRPSQKTKSTILIKRAIHK